MTNHSTPRKPTQRELEALFQHELAAFYEHEPFFPADDADIESMIKGAIQDARIAVFDARPECWEKTMILCWALDENYMVYTWKNGKLKAVKQGDKMVEAYYPKAT